MLSHAKIILEWGETSLLANGMTENNYICVFPFKKMQGENTYLYMMYFIVCLGDWCCCATERIWCWERS